MHYRRYAQLGTALLAILYASFAGAQIYKCVGDDGRLTFSDTECPDKTRGAVVVIQDTNGADPFATPNEISANQARRAKERRTHRAGWMDANENSLAQEDEGQKDRLDQARRNSRYNPKTHAATEARREYADEEKYTLKANKPKKRN